MKKLILIFAIIGMSFGTLAQSSLNKGVTILLDSLDVSAIGATATYYWLAPNGNWAIAADWSGVTGSGTCEILLSNDDDITRTFTYDALDPISFSVTGATGSTAYARPSPILAYFIIKVTKSTLSAGKLTIKINIK